MPAPLECFPIVFHVELSSFKSYTITPPLLLFTKSFHSYLCIHITFTILSSNDLTMHAFADSIYPPRTKPASTPTIFHLRLVHSSSQPLSVHALHLYERLQNTPIDYNTHMFSHTNSAAHLLIPPTIHPGHSAQTPCSLHVHNIQVAFLLHLDAQRFNTFALTLAD